MPAQTRRTGRSRAIAHAAAALVVLTVALLGRPLTGDGLYGPGWNPLLADSGMWELPHVAATPPAGAGWSPYAALGHPIGVFSHPTAHYPPAALLHLALPPWSAKTVQTAAHTLLFGLGLLAWCLARGLGPRAATIGATLGMLAPGYALWVAYPHRTAGLAWVAVALAAAEVAARRRSARAAVLCGLALGLALLPAIDQVPFHGAFLVAVVVGPRGRADLGAGAGRIAWVALAAGVVFAPRAVPLVIEALDGHRPPGTAPPLFAAGHALLALVPDALGSPLRGVGLLADVRGAVRSPYLNPMELPLYAGTVTVALALAGAFVRDARGLAALVAAGVLFACAPALAEAAGRIPGFGSSPSARVLPIVHILLAPLAAHGAAAWLRGRAAASRAAIGVGLASVVVAVTLSTPWGAGRYLALFDDPGRAAAYAARQLDLGGAIPPAPWGAVRRTEHRAAFLPPATFMPLVLGVGLVLAGTRRGAGLAGLTALLALGAFDLLLAGLTWTGTAPRPADLLRPPDDVEAARALAEGDRVAWLAPPRVEPNRLLLHRLRSVGGYHAMFPRRTARLLLALGPRHAMVQLLRPEPLPPAWRDALSVRALVGPDPLPSATAQALAPTAPAARGPGWLVWLNPDALPRARIHPTSAVVAVPGLDEAVAAVVRSDFDPRRQVALEGPPLLHGHAGAAEAPAPPAPARLLADEAERLVIEVPAEAAAEGGVLVVADAWGRGWSARDGAGRPLELRPAQVALRGVVLPPGSSGSVVLTYRRPGRWEGAALAAVLAAALTACAARRARRRPARRVPAAS